MSQPFAVARSDGAWIGVSEPIATAAPGGVRPLALIYGPDHMLKAAAAAFKAQRPDFDTVLRSTDIDLSYADDVPCSLRVILESDRDSLWMTLWSRLSMKFARARLVGHVLEWLDVNDKPKPAHVIADLPPHRLANGIEVPGQEARERGATLLGVSLDVFDTYEATIRNHAIEKAYEGEISAEPQTGIASPIGKQPEPKQKAKGKRK